MRLNSRDLIIAILIMFNIALMVLVYKVNRLVVESTPTQVEPHVYVMGLTKAVEKQIQVTTDLFNTMVWLKRHLDNSLSLIESERNLEPIQIERPNWLGMQLPDECLLENKELFVIPYAKTQVFPDSPEQEKNLRYLVCLINLSTLGTTMSMYNVDMEINNLQMRLQRIAPDSDPNSANSADFIEIDLAKRVDNHP